MKKEFFTWVTKNPKKIMIAGILLILFFAYGATKIIKDTSADAFIAKDHPALINKNKLVELFGLEDPLVVVVENKDGIFNPKTLDLIYKLSEDIQTYKEVKNDGVTSLSTEKNIYGLEDGMEVENFILNENTSQSLAKEIEAHMDSFPLMQGTLVSLDKKATLIIVDMINKNDAEALYFKLLELAEKSKTNDIELYVAGEGAVSGYMGSYIDKDAKVLNLLAGLIIMVVLYIAFRKLGAVLLANLVILGATISALGFMGMNGVSFFIITNALPVVLIGIAVADTIHILSTFFERRRDFPEEKYKDAIVETLLEMWRPIGLTTLTTMAGFLGLSLSSTMPPMIYFGLFAMVGVAMAWLFSITVLPAMMSLLKLKQSSRFKQKEEQNQILGKLGHMVASYPKRVLVLVVLIAIFGLSGFVKVIVNEDRITVFNENEPIVQADKVINGRFKGSHYLDILIDSSSHEGLFELDVMTKVEALQTYAKTLPYVQGSVAYTDYLKQMNKSLHEADVKQYILPPSSEAASQYFLLYSARAAADDFENILDYDFQKANVRIYINTGEYIHDKEIVTKIQSYLDKHIINDRLTAQISGRANIDYHWVKPIETSHFMSVGISLLLVFIMAYLSFRSLGTATLVTVPVVLSILMIYGIMGYNGIWLGIGTSMFAAIAIGLGVDFAVHTAQRFESLSEQTSNIKEQVVLLYSSTGRALFFNAMALTLGFGVLASSKVVPLVEFGILVSVAIVSSFLFSLLIIPAVMVLKTGNES